MMQLHFQDVWERTLSNRQKEELTQLVQSLPAAKTEFDLLPILLKYKKNGGLVATVFLRNNSDQSVSINTLHPYIQNTSGELVAEQSFDLQLTIPAASALPWSFVFAADRVRLHGIGPDDMTIHYK